MSARRVESLAEHAEVIARTWETCVEVSKQTSLADSYSRPFFLYFDPLVDHCPITRRRVECLYVRAF